MINREKYLNELFSKYSGFWNAGALVLDQLNENYAVKGILGYSMVADEVANNQAKVYDKEEGGIDDVEFQKIYEQYYSSALEVKPFVIEAFILSNLCQDEIQENTLKAIKNFSNKEEIYTEELYEYLDKLEKQESFMQDMVWNNASFDWDSFSQREINVLMNNEHTIHSFFEKNSNRIEDEWERIGIAIEETLRLFTPQTREELLKLVKNLSINLGDIDTSKITDMSYLFFDTQRTHFSGIENWDVSNVESMAAMFKGAKSFNADISKWNVRSVRDMEGMFAFATSFNQDISKWNVSNVEDMAEMFARAESFNADISKWNVSKVWNMHGMFEDAISFNADISKWDVSNVKDMRNMFAFARVFNQDISSWDVSNVRDMFGMFQYTKSFNQDISGWDVSNVKNMASMFREAESFNQPIGKWNVSRVENMENMFAFAKAFNQDISKWDVSKVESMSCMFQGTTSFNQPIGDWDVSKVEEMQDMFYGATSFNADISGWNVGNVKDMRYMFYEAKTFNQDLSDWDLSSIEYIDNETRDLIRNNHNNIRRM